MTPSTIEIGKQWRAALEQAQLGEVEPARTLRATHPEGAMHQYFYGRCLTEARTALDEALEALDAARRADAANPLIPHVQALAHLCRGDAAEARELFEAHGLPHDLDLLGAVALEMERQLRPLDLASPLLQMPWPAGLPEPAPECPAGGDTLTRPEDTLMPEGATRASGKPATTGQLEKLFVAFRYGEVLEGAAQRLALGREDAETHLIAGIAAEEAGVLDRARAHLTRSIELEPTMLMARMGLSRTYLRAGWFEPALALARSLPVEGPNDNGRHYLLALVHEACGDRTAAREAMDLALTDFFYDTRHFYIKRAHERWSAQAGGVPHPASG